jgi:hypothetical protein
MYKNRVLEFSDRYPIVAFFVVPMGMNIGATFLHGMIRKHQTGSAFQGIGAGEEDETNMLAGLRTEGGDDKDMWFRATAPTGTANFGISEAEEIHGRPTGAPVRYDEAYHDVGFFTDVSYTPNQGSITQPRHASVKQSFVFAGLDGMNKVNRW